VSSDVVTRKSTTISRIKSTRMQGAGHSANA
jgi:hypothetical protein